MQRDNLGQNEEIDEKNVCKIGNRYTNELNDTSHVGTYEFRIVNLEKRMEELQRIIREAG